MLQEVFILKMRQKKGKPGAASARPIHTSSVLLAGEKGGKYISRDIHPFFPFLKPPPSRLPRKKRSKGHRKKKKNRKEAPPPSPEKLEEKSLGKKNFVII